MKSNLIVVAGCCWLMTLSFSGLSQKRGPELIDSLEKALTRLGEDTNKVNTLITLGRAYGGVDLIKAFPPTRQGLELAEKLHYLKGIANAENNTGLYMSDTGNQVG